MANAIPVRVPGTGGSTLQYVLPANMMQFVQSVNAVIDNSAGGDTNPVLTVLDSTNEVIADVPQGRSIPAGDAGRATWALGLDDEDDGSNADLDDVRFNDPNTETDPRYLTIPVNDAGPSGYQFNVEGDSLRLFALDRVLGGGFILLQVDTSNTAVTLTKATANVTGYQHLRLISDTGDFVLVAGNGDGVIRAVTAGKAIRIRTAAGTDVIVALDQKVGFFNATPVARQNITGSRGGNAALASLLTGLANLGLITDSTTP